jgi:hypothetical protein
MRLIAPYMVAMCVLFLHSDGIPLNFALSAVPERLVVDARVAEAAKLGT